MHVKEINYYDPKVVAQAFSDQFATILLHSEMQHSTGLYSYLAINPKHILRLRNNTLLLDDKPINSSLQPTMQGLIDKYKQPIISELPPFQCGFAGFFSYDYKNYLETIETKAIDDANFPDVFLGFYTNIISFDHGSNRAWIISCDKNTNDAIETQIDYTPITLKPIVASTISSNFTKEDYLRTIERAKQYVLDGDVFEVNIAQRFKCEINSSSYDLFLNLMHNNPAPFAAYINCGEHSIVSASPERFIQTRSDKVETRPIKGTRKKGKNDKEIIDELISSDKDRSENIMIVDLLRNDLSRVCKDDTIEVSQLCGIESFATVHHLVSAINGELQADKTMLDLFAACFPGGSITGAPKIRSMEIIDTLEPHARGPYCGCIAYFGTNNCMDSSIIIRSYAITGNTVTFHAGGAIVLDSSPVDEYLETCSKAEALIKTLTNDSYNR